MKLYGLLLLLPFLSLTGAHDHQAEPQPDADTLASLKAKWDYDFSFSGIPTFAHLPYTKCLLAPSESYDIAIVGAPFDTAVSYRPGARFGPRAIRAASQRQTSFRSFNAQQGINPYLSWAKVLDCGDIPISPFDNALALQQMEAAFTELGAHRSGSGGKPPLLVTLGGDHSIALAALRALKARDGEAVAVLHFDAHLDTWLPAKYPSPWPSDQQAFTHGTMFALAHNESLLLPGTSVHAGLRTRLSGTDFGDYEDDDAQGWYRIEADEIDAPEGVDGVIERILGRLRGKKVYLSVDIDVLDPGLAPGTGTPEPGGWTTRELMRILRRVVGEVDVVGVDVVEVAPAYDGVGEVTALAAAQVVFEVVSGVVKKGVLERKRLQAERAKDEL